MSVNRQAGYSLLPSFKAKFSPQKAHNAWLEAQLAALYAHRPLRARRLSEASMSIQVSLSETDTMLKMIEEKQSFEEPQGKPSLEEPQAKPALDFGQVGAHLANERTFLAWTWTGMLLMGFGVAIAKMRIAISDFSQTTGTASQSSGEREISPITMGILFLVLGLVTILLSACRYLAVQNQLRERKYHLSNILFFVFLTALAFLGGTLIVHVLQLRQTLE